jgi:hypothetical protein
MSIEVFRKCQVEVTDQQPDFDVFRVFCQGCPRHQAEEFLGNDKSICDGGVKYLGHPPTPVPGNRCPFNVGLRSDPIPGSKKKQMMVCCSSPELKRSPAKAPAIVTS